jgi:DNA-binding NtrC family response regulator
MAERVSVLLVDDEADFVFTLAERLKLRGFQVSATTKATDVMAKLKENGVRVILLDVKMPGIDGLKLMSEIKREQPDLRIILLTGHGSVADAKRGMEEGAVDYLMKPVDIEELTEKIRNAAE